MFLGDGIHTTLIKVKESIGVDTNLISGILIRKGDLNTGIPREMTMRRHKEMASLAEAYTKLALNPLRRSPPSEYLP